jgi:hydrogenase nickel incorporation protein HypA/HybF
MHELSIAQNIVDIIGQYVRDEQAAEVRQVKVRIGPLAGIVADSLDFCFGAIVAGTPLANARLAFEETAIRSSCGGCGRIFEVESAEYACPGCGSAEVTVVSGTELQVVEIELSDRERGSE